MNLDALSRNARWSRTQPRLVPEGRAGPPAALPPGPAGPVFRWHVLLAFFVLFAAGCGPSPAQPKGRPVVVTSFFPLYDFTQRLVGTDAEVLCLTPAGGQPHGAELTPSAARQTARADLVLRLGLGLDDWVEKLGGADQARRVVRLGEGLARPLPLPAGPGGAAVTEHETGVDPHVWLDPVLAQEIVRRLSLALGELLPKHRSSIVQREEILRAELSALDAEFAGAAQRFSQRRVVTFHGAFGYLFARYGLEVAGCVEPFPGREPSAAYVRELVDLMRGLGIRVIFAEPQLPDQAARVIAREIEGRVERLDPCETILPESTQRGYVERQRANCAVLRQVLGAGRAD